MTLGDGIFYSTLLLVLAAAIYQISVRHKWKLVGKVVGALVVLAGVVGLGTWLWDRQANKPTEVTEFVGLRLGMAPVDVTLLKGEPARRESEDPSKADERSFDEILFYGSDGDQTIVMLDTGDDEKTVVSSICRTGGYEDLLGVSQFAKEDQIVARLGEPEHTSVRANGLEKLISYPRWNVSIQLEKGDVTMLCATSSEKGLRFAEEYGGNPFRDELAERAGRLQEPAQ